MRLRNQRINLVSPRQVASLWGAVAFVLAASAICLSTFGVRDRSHRAAPAAEFLTAQPAEKDFGWLTQMDCVRAEFTLRNESTHPVRIISVTPHCSCSAAAIPRYMLEPGESVPLTINWNLENQRGNTTSKIWVTALSEHADALVTRELSLRAQVIPRFYLEPARITLDETKKCAVPVRILPGCVRAARLVSTHVEHPGLTAEVCDDGESLIVNYDPALRPAGMGRAEVVVLCDAEIECCAVLPIEFHGH